MDCPSGPGSCFTPAPRIQMGPYSPRSSLASSSWNAASPPDMLDMALKSSAAPGPKGSMSRVRHIGHVTLFLCVLHVSNWACVSNNALCTLQNTRFCTYPLENAELSKDMPARQLNCDLLFLASLDMLLRVVFRTYITRRRCLCR